MVCLAENILIHSIQYLRGVAALLVLLTHVALKSQAWEGSGMGAFLIGNLGVDIFFVISGYIMCLVGVREGVLDFFRSRIKRIIPLYWLLTTFALVVFILFPGKVNSSGGETSILGSYLLVPIWGKFLVQNGWTLSYEFVFYFIFAAGIALGGRMRLWAPVAIILVLVLIGLGGVDIPVLTSPMLLEFLFGMAAFHARALSRPGVVSGCLLLAAAWGWLALLDHLALDPGRVASFGVAAFLIVLGGLRMEALLLRNTRAPAARLMRLLGDASYSIYLSHPFVLAGLSAVLLRSGMVGSRWLAVLLMVSLSVLAGYACYVFVERRMARMLARAG